MHRAQPVIVSFPHENPTRAWGHAHGTSPSSEYVMSTIKKFGALTLFAALAGCVAPPQQPPAQIPFVAVPGPTKTEAEFRQDDTTCRAAAVQLPAAPATAGEPASAAPPPVPPGVTYLHCMEVRQNQIEPLAAVQPPLYAYYPAYPVYYRYGYPWAYPAYAYGFGFGYGFGFYGGGYGRYRGGYGYGYGHGFGDGGFHGGWHGGFGHH